LGKAADIEAAINGSQVMPDRTRHLAFGDVDSPWVFWRLVYLDSSSLGWICCACQTAS
jgi:hypothetical protein